MRASGFSLMPLCLRKSSSGWNTSGSAPISMDTYTTVSPAGSVSRFQTASKTAWDTPKKVP